MDLLLFGVHPLVVHSGLQLMCSGGGGGGMLSLGVTLRRGQAALASPLGALKIKLSSPSSSSS